MNILKIKIMKEKHTITIKDKEYSFIQNNELLNQLFWALGATLAEIQSFETGIIFFLGGIKSKSCNNLEATSEKDESKTLGILINELIKYIEVDEIKNMLCQIRDDRNYIVHKILRKYGWPIMSESKYEYAINEILEIREIMHVAEPIIMDYINSNNILSLIDCDYIIERIKE